MTILHDLAPLGATPATQRMTTPGDGYPDGTTDRDGYPMVVVRDRHDRVVQTQELGDADPADQHQTALAMAKAWAQVAERYAELEVRAGGEA